MMRGAGTDLCRYESGGGGLHEQSAKQEGG